MIMYYPNRPGAASAGLVPQVAPVALCWGGTRFASAPGGYRGGS